MRNGNSMTSTNGRTEPAENVLFVGEYELEELVLVEGKYEEDVLLIGELADDPPNEPNALAIAPITAIATNHKIPTIKPKLTKETNPTNPPFVKPSE